MTDPIMGFDVDGSHIEFTYVAIPITADRKIIVLVTKAQADAGWGISEPGVYDLWEVDDEDAGTYKPWAKWRVTEEGVVLSSRIPETDTPNPCEGPCHCRQCIAAKTLR